MKKLIRIFFIFLTTVFSAGCLSYLTAYTYIVGNAEFSNVTQADAAMVLGTNPYQDGKLSPCFVARVQTAVDLYKNGKIKAIFVTGGKGRAGIGTEADVMQKVAIEAGVPAQYVFTETNATSTQENIVFTKPGLDYYQAKSVIIVTDPYHSPRGYLVAKRYLDQTIMVQPALSSPCWKGPGKYFSYTMLREPLAMVYYLFHGYL